MYLVSSVAEKKTLDALLVKLLSSISLFKKLYLKKSFFILLFSEFGGQRLLWDTLVQLQLISVLCSTVYLLTPPKIHILLALLSILSSHDEAIFVPHTPPCLHTPPPYTPPGHIFVTPKDGGQVLYHTDTPGVLRIHLQPHGGRCAMAEGTICATAWSSTGEFFVKIRGSSNRRKI